MKTSGIRLYSARWGRAPNGRVSRGRCVPWTEGRGSRGRLWDRQSPSGLDVRALPAPHLPAPSGRPQLLAFCLEQLLGAALSGSSACHKGRKFPVCPASIPPSKGSSRVPSGGQTCPCDLEFTSYPRTWSSGSGGIGTHLYNFPCMGLSAPFIPMVSCISFSKGP